MVQPRSTRSTVRRQPRSSGPAPQWQRVACRMIVAIFGISIALYISNLESEAIGKATETSVEQHAKHDHDEFVDDDAQSNQAPGVSGADAIKSEGDFHSQKKELYQKPGGGTGTTDKRQEMLDKLRSRREEREAGGGLHHDHSIHGVNQPPEITGMMDNLRGNPVKGDDDDDDDSATATASDDEEDTDEDSPDSDDDEDDSDEDDEEGDSPDDLVDRDTPDSPSVDTDDEDTDGDDEDDATEATNGDESKDGEDEPEADDDVVHTEDSPSKKDVEGDDDTDDDVVRDEPLVKPKTKVKVRLDREDEDDSGEEDSGEEVDAGTDTGDIVDTEASPSKKDLDSDEDKDGDDDDDEDEDEDDGGVVEQGPPTAATTTDEGDSKTKKKKPALASHEATAKAHGGFAQPAYSAARKEEKGTTTTGAAGDDDSSAGGKGYTTSATTKTKPKVGKIALLGERNTGTRWMSAQLEECFPSLKVTPRLLRWKHWFQEDDGSKHDDTLVISQFRNVYEWTEAMRVVPHHAPLHVKLDWKDFVTKPWTMERPKRDLPFKDSKEQVCFEKFKYNQLISCIEGSRNDTSYLEYGCDPDRHYSCHKPIYELKQDDSGDPYENILEMRADKIRNFVLDIKKWNWIADVIPVQYEALLSNGTDFLISRVEEVTGVKRKCKAVGAQVRKRRVLDPEMIEWLNDHVDWEAEALVEYKKWDKQGTADKNDEIGKGEGEGDSLATEMSESADEKEGGKKSAELSDEGEDGDGKKLKGDVKGEDVGSGGEGEDSGATEMSASADEKDEGEAGNEALDVKDEDVSGEKVASKKRKYT